MTIDKALLDRAELRLVGLDIDVDILQLPGFLAIEINDHLAAPFGDIPLSLDLIFTRLGRSLIV